MFSNWELISVVYILLALTAFAAGPLIVSRGKFERMLAAVERIELGWRDRFIQPATPLFQALGISPNAISFFGIGLTFVLAYLFFLRAPIPWLFITATAAALTDMLDGPLARLTNRVTSLGGFLDGFRDLLLFAVLSVGLLRLELLPWNLFFWFGLGSLAIVGLKLAEILVVSRRAGMGRAFTHRITGQGKLEIDRIKAFCCFAGLILFLAAPFLPVAGRVGRVFFLVAIVTVALSVLIHSAMLRFRLAATLEPSG